MPSPITERDIAKYYNKFKSLGVMPTIDGIINAHGSGSKSTIGPILKRLKEQDARPDSTGGIPNSVFNPLKAIFEKMELEKSEWERQKTEAFEAAIHEQVQLTDEQIQHRKKAERKNQELETTIETLKVQLAQKDKALGEARVERDTLQTQVKENQATFSHQQSEIQKLHDAGQAIRENAQQEIKTLQQSHNQYVDSLKDQLLDITTERNHALQLNEKHHEGLAALRLSLETAQSQIASTTNELKQSQQAAETLKNDLRHEKKEVSELKRMLLADKSIIQELNQINQALQKQYDKLFEKYDMSVRAEQVLKCELEIRDKQKKRPD